jgi:Zn-dependent peptidase ImmA (M78 family)
MDENELGWFERQAHEFAGRLLVPIDPLVKIYMHIRSDILKKVSWADKIDNKEIITIASPKIGDEFGVSADVIERRFQRESSVRERLGF